MQTDYRTGRVVGLATSAALGGFLFGYDSAVINGASSAIKTTFGLGDFAFSGHIDNEVLDGLRNGDDFEDTYPAGISGMVAMFTAGGLIETGDICRNDDSRFRRDKREDFLE